MTQKHTHNNISYTKVGTGPHLCFLHGFCENSSIWRHLIAELQSQYTCIAIDLPGFGESSASALGSMKEVATQVHDILTYENARHTVLLGHSMGGYVLAEYMAMYGIELSAAAFVHSTAQADSLSKKQNRNKSIAFIQRKRTNTFFKLFIPGLVASPHFDRLEKELTQMVAATSQRAVLEGLKAMKQRANHLSTLAAFQKPVLFIRGTEDTYYTAADICHQASLCSNSMLREIPHAGHLSMYEYPELCLEAVWAFLEELKR